ncbi:amidase family protein [Isobaculum melis]|uniref:Amidase n=1 Tax=Isobaculum melis TaxID=142588 RepID=A0A1H9UAK5_9LACT|nr:amidase family protein [Isobaculum melis]SES06362.1 Amidase [Isobaculum melis]
MKKTVKEFAKATMLAYQNPYHSVAYIAPPAFDEACQQLEADLTPFYFGVKETPVLNPCQMALSEAGMIFHTIDKMSDHGRAIDTTLVNPLTGRSMTGSSSGTAINVLLGMNDIGIGSDGGGSVLAPAMALQLYGLIHPALPVVKVKKQSTDNLTFTPSAGFITRNFACLAKGLAVFDLKPEMTAIKVAIPKGLSQEFLADLAPQLSALISLVEVDYPDCTAERSKLIPWLEQMMQQYDVVISLEGPIDTSSYGDSLLGSFSELRSAAQQESGKGLLRIVNMLDLVGLTIPYDDLAKGLLLIANPAKTSAILAIAQAVQPLIPELVQRYFHKK